jgi:hypothetical protein
LFDGVSSSGLQELAKKFIARFVARPKAGDGIYYNTRGKLPSLIKSGINVKNDETHNAPGEPLEMAYDMLSNFVS